MNPDNSPLVSVIVPMYNTRAYILDTLTSILESTYRPLEVIVVDDGSTDDSLALVQHFAQQHPECKVIAQANLGVSVTRNHAIRIAKGKYILPVDSDDKIGKTFIEHAVERIESDSDIRIVGCRGWKFGAVDEEWRFPDYNRSIMARRNIIPVTSLYRRCDWETVGGYCEQEIYMEDWDFWLSMLELGGRYVRLDEIGIYYRIRPESRWHVAREHKRQTVAALNYRHPEFMHQYWNGPLYHHHIYSKLINLFYRETVRGDFHAWHRGEPIRQDGNRQLRRHQDYFIAEYTVSSWWEGWKMTLTRSNPARRAYNCLVQTHQAVAFREVRYLGSVRQSWYVYRDNSNND